jgi:uncharacterized membrane protein
MSELGGDVECAQHQHSPGVQIAVLPNAAGLCLVATMYAIEVIIMGISPINRYTLLTNDKAEFLMHRSRLVLAILLLLFASACVPVQNATPSPPSQTNAEGVDCTKIPGACETQNVLTALVTYVSFLAELCGAVVIGVGILRAIISYLPHMFARENPELPYTENIRLQLGKALTLALEFEIGADILKTAVVPSLQIIAQLAAIVVLRTLLNYFLERELRQTEQRRAGMHLVPAQQEAEEKSMD